MFSGERAFSLWRRHFDRVLKVELINKYVLCILLIDGGARV